MLKAPESLRCSTSGKGANHVFTHTLYTPFRSHGAPDARKARQAPGATPNCRIPSSVLSWSESSRARSFPGPSSCGASSRSPSNSGWPARASRSRSRCSRTSCTGKERIRRRCGSRRSGGRQAVSRQAPPGDLEGRSDPVVISLPKGSYVPVFETNSASPSQRFRHCSRKRSRRRYVPEPQAREGSRRCVAVVAAVIVAGLAWRTLPAGKRPGPAVSLAWYPGREGAPAMSPDGNLVAFAWSGHATAGPTEIYVKAVESEALRRLTQTPDWETSPAWSPDGRSIAFVRDGHGVFTMSQLGGAERQVSASGTHVAWARDSKSVLIRDRKGDSGPFGILQVVLDTLERRRLTQAPVGDGDWRLRYRRTAARWRSYAMRRGESPTCTSYPWQAANRGGSRTGAPASTGYRGRPMVGRLSTRSTSRQRVGYGESAPTAPHLLEDRRLPTSQRRP